MAQVGTLHMLEHLFLACNRLTSIPPPLERLSTLGILFFKLTDWIHGVNFWARTRNQQVWGEQQLAHTKLETETERGTVRSWGRYSGWGTRNPKP